MAITLFILLLFISMFFSGSETALFSISKVAQRRLEHAPGRLDTALADLLASPRRLLVTVLLGNELTNIGLSVVAAAITRDLLTDRTLVEQSVLSAAMVVPVLLVVGEITPKTIAAHRAEAIARLASLPLSVFARLTRPVVFLLHELSDALVRAAGGAEASHIDESEFRLLVDAGERDGVVDAQERELIHNVLNFGDTKVAAVMKPWPRVFTLDESTPVERAIEELCAYNFSRVPLWRGTTNNIVGVIHAKDLLPIRWGVSPPRSLRRLARKPIFTLPQANADDLLETFQQHRVHIAIVVDEFGAPVGLCTMEDLLEELVGPIHDTEAEEAEEAEEAIRDLTPEAG